MNDPKSGSNWSNTAVSFVLTAIVVGGALIFAFA